MITQEQKDKWIAALRSGEYKQTARCLHGYDGGYCCVGVYFKAVLGMSLYPTDIDDDTGLGIPDDRKPLYDELREKLGIEFVSELVKMNDTKVTFLEISNFIDREL